MSRCKKTFLIDAFTRESVNVLLTIEKGESLRNDVDQMEKNTNADNVSVVVLFITSIRLSSIASYLINSEMTKKGVIYKTINAKHFLMKASQLILYGCFGFFF